MSENIFASFDISGQGMSVQRMRLSAVAKNIANANTTSGPDGQPYQREVVLVNSVDQSEFGQELDNQISLTTTTDGHSDKTLNADGIQNNSTLEARIAKDNSPARLIYDPAHPDADENGYVHMPDINIVSEMVEMISAQRAFQANTNVIDAAKNIARNSMEI